MKNFILYAALLLMAGCAGLPEVGADERKKYAQGVISREMIRVGGIPQYISIRGMNANRPILLLLHGGPGSPVPHSLLRKFLPELEHLFIVVNWHQRGAGRSYNSDLDPALMTIDGMTNDTIQVTRFLLRRFKRKKIFLMGGSWGSFLGVMAIRKHPELYHAFIGTGQVVHQARGEILSHEYTMRKARAAGNRGDARTLREIGRPPYSSKTWLSDLRRQRELLLKYGGSARNAKVKEAFACPYHLITPWRILTSREYGLASTWNWVRGQEFSEKHLGPRFRRINFLETAVRLRVPVFIIQGRHDFQTPTPLVRTWFARLRAPKKELHLMENSAHLPFMEEPGRFAEILRERVLAAGAGDAHSRTAGNR